MTRLSVDYGKTSKMWEGSSVPVDELIPGIFLHHWHDIEALDGTCAEDAGAFEALRDIQAMHGFQIVGEPVETTIPAACRWQGPYPVVRHFLYPVREMGKAAV